MNSSVSTRSQSSGWRRAIWVCVAALGLSAARDWSLAWDPLLHLRLATAPEVREAAAKKYTEADFPGELNFEAYEAGALAPDLLVLPPLSDQEALDVLKFLLGEALPPGAPNLPRRKPDALEDFERRKQLNKQVGVPYFHGKMKFALSLWGRARQADDNGALASFALGWVAHIACDAAFDRSETQEGVNLNDTKLLRFVLLTIAWEDPKLPVSEIADAAAQRAAAARTFASDLVAVYGTFQDRKVELRDTDIKSTVLPDAIQCFRGLVPMVLAAHKLAAGLSDLAGQLGGPEAPKITPLTDLSVNDPIFLLERGNKKAKERKLIEVLTEYSTASRRTAVEYLKFLAKPAK